MVQFPLGEMQLVEAAGTPYEIGYAHGAAAKEKILRGIANYTHQFRTWSSLSWEEAKIRSRQFVSVVEAADPDLIEEVRGVADGAGLEFDDIMTLNVRSEVLYSLSTIGDACTSFAVTPEYSENAHTFLGQNWDWREDQMENLIILKIRQENKPNIFMVTEAGIIGKIGMNSAGLGVCLNALSVTGEPKGLPLHFALRRVLNSFTVSDAMDRLNEQRLAGPGNYMLAQDDGTVIDLERTPDAWAYLVNEKGYLVHANHIKDTVLRAKVTDGYSRYLPDSFLRDSRLDMLLKAAPGEVGLNYLMTCMRDHRQYPNSICHHMNVRQMEQMREITAFSIIMDLSAREAWVCWGPPCRNEYIRYSVTF